MGSITRPLALGEVLFHPGRSFEEQGVPNEALGRWEQGLLEERLLIVHLPFLARTLYSIAGKSTKHFKSFLPPSNMKHGINPLVDKGAEHVVVQKLRVNFPGTLYPDGCVLVLQLR